MPNKWFLFVAAIVMTLACITTTQAQTRPIQLALVTPIQIFPEGDAIGGVRLNLLYGRNASMTGLDLGLANHIKEGGFKGVSFAFVGLCDGNFTGWQDGAVSITKGNFEGLQMGLFNSANFVKGLQFGVVNYVGSMKGLQIGIINIIRQGGAFPVFPIVNWSL